MVNSDSIYKFLLRSSAWGLVLLIGILSVSLFYYSFDSYHAFGLGFFASSDWDPMGVIYGALPFIQGTLVTSLLAILIALVPSLSMALVTNEFLPHKFKKYISFIIEILAAIPSIIYGMWAIFILTPFTRDYLFPLSQKIFPGFVLFEGPSFGVGVLTASIILAIMISPIITSICIEVFKAIPQLQRYAALALGATKYEMVKIALIKPGLSGILGAVTLALGRALGETMAVAMVIGNTTEIFSSLFAPASTLASVTANEYNEALDDLHLSSLTYLAFSLFIITLVVNTISALDPIATVKIEELMEEIKKDYTVVIVTHNMQQAKRMADKTHFFMLGELVESNDTKTFFTSPSDIRSMAYLEGQFS